MISWKIINSIKYFMIMILQFKFMSIYLSTFIISVVFMVLCPNTIAFGAVATGRAKAQEHTMPKKKV